jgi:hypothetical protein
VRQNPVMEEPRPGIEYHVHFANGETNVRQTLRAAREFVMQRTNFDQAPPNLLPAEIWEIGPNDVGVGRLVDRIG